MSVGQDDQDCGPYPAASLTRIGVYVLARVLARWLAFLIGNQLIPFNELKNIVYLCVSCKLLKLRMRFGLFSLVRPLAIALALHFDLFSSQDHNCH